MSREQIKLASDRISQIRKQAGEDMDIMIEMHALTDTNTAIQVGRELNNII